MQRIPGNDLTGKYVKLYYDIYSMTVLWWLADWHFSM